MALIGKIRKHSWVLIVLIGLGLASFILMDMFAGDKSAFGSSQNIMGSFGDKKLDYTEFSKTEQALYGNSSGDVFTRRNVLWNYFVEEALVKKQADALGLGVCRDELMDLQFGANPSPIITQRFMDPNTRQIDRAQLNNIKQTLEAGNLQDAIDKGQLNPSFPGFWAHQEKEIIKDRLQSKLSTMVSKAMYTPTWMVEQAHADQNQRVEFEYVQIPFDEVDDSDVSLTDADYTNYLNSNKGKFVTDEETRKLAYFSFDVIPTLGDSAKIKEGLVELKTAFAETTDDSIFVENNYGTMDPAYLSKDKVSAAIAETVFDLPAGSVYGPYIDNGNYQLVKVIDNMTVADSVKSRHILIKATNQTELVAGNNTIDSLKALIEAGTNDFADLAKQFSQGPSASKGGDLGYAAPGAMVKPFNDLIYFTAEVGNVYKVFTQFGVHLVEVQDRKYINNNQGVQLAYIAQPIVPSQETQDVKYEEVLGFIQKNRSLDDFNKVASEDGSIDLITSPPLKQNDFVVGALGTGQASRDIVKWGYSADVGDVSPSVYIYQDPVNYFNSKYVAVALKNTVAAGNPSVAGVKEEIAPFVKNLKKADIIKSKITSQDLASIASTFSSQVDTAKNVSFSSSYTPGLGNEPEVVSSAFNLDVNGVSKPIAGNNGVYIVRLIKKPEIGAPSNIPQLRKQTSQSIQSQISSRLIQAIKKDADIEDNRSRFY